MLKLTPQKEEILLKRQEQALPEGENDLVIKNNLFNLVFFFFEARKTLRLNDL